MIQGRFGDKAQVYFDVELIDQNNLSLSVEVMLDTGFTGFIAMNKQDIQGLDWRFLRQNKLKTAQGEAFFDIYLGKIIIDNQEFEITAFAGDEIQEILLGSQWLKIFTLMADYRKGEVTLTRD